MSERMQMITHVGTLVVSVLTAIILIFGGGRWLGKIEQQIDQMRQTLVEVKSKTDANHSLIMRGVENYEGRISRLEGRLAEVE